MHELELLKTIRPIWLHRVVQNMARGAGLREDLQNQMAQFFTLLEQAVETGDSAWLDSILSLWSSSLTQTDLEGSGSNLTNFIVALLKVTFDTCRETLDEVQALNLIGALLPCFSYCFEKTAQFEIQAKVGYVSNRLNQVQQSLERLDRTKSDFIAVAAHELKTPLTLIEGYTAMLGESYSKNGLDSSEMVLLNGINNGTRRLRIIVDDMIDVSLIDNNLLKLNFQPVWLNQIFTALEAELQDYIDERKLTLEILSYPGSQEMIFGDPERLIQVFRNLLTNAIKYTPDGGSITIDGRKLPGFVETTIHDTGIGIASENQMIIFEKFSRIGNPSLHSSGKTKYKGGGPGLGLHIAKGIIESHGGAIWVESPGFDEVKMPGSTFHVILPIHNIPADERMARIFAPLAKPEQT